VQRFGKKPHHETTDHHKFTLGKIYDGSGVIRNIKPYTNQSINRPDGKTGKKELQKDSKQVVIFPEEK
jgi:hypothetical protein